MTHHVPNPAHINMHALIRGMFLISSNTCLKCIELCPSMIDVCEAFKPRPAECLSISDLLLLEVVSPYVRAYIT